ncbi:MAG: hypothetical protein AAFZ65_00085, partial [Planctomycetota bacterium]
FRTFGTRHSRPTSSTEVSLVALLLAERAGLPEKIGRSSLDNYLFRQSHYHDNLYAYPVQAAVARHFLRGTFGLPPWTSADYRRELALLAASAFVAALALVTVLRTSQNQKRV